MTRSPRGTETVLLVEDEDSVRHMACEVLSRSGYKVLDASDGAEALSRCGRHRGPIHLVLADVLLPHMTSQEMVERLKRLRPGMKVLYISGYTEGAASRFGVAAAHTAFLPKPFTMQALVQKVRETLDR